MSKYYKAEDVIRKRAEDLADTSYWEYGNPKNVDDWIEVAEMEFKDLPTIDIVRCKDCKNWDDDSSKCTKWTTDTYEQAQTNADAFCSYGERIDNE